MEWWKNGMVELLNCGMVGIMRVGY